MPKNSIKLSRDDFIVIDEALSRQKEFYLQFLTCETRNNFPEIFAELNEDLLKTLDVIERIEIDAE